VRSEGFRKLKSFSRTKDSTRSLLRTTIVNSRDIVGTSLGTTSVVSINIVGIYRRLRRALLGLIINISSLYLSIRL